MATVLSHSSYIQTSAVEQSELRFLKSLDLEINKSLKNLAKTHTQTDEKNRIKVSVEINKINCYENFGCKLSSPSSPA